MSLCTIYHMLNLPHYERTHPHNILKIHVLMHHLGEVVSSVSKHKQIRDHPPETVEVGYHTKEKDFQESKTLKCHRAGQGC